MWNLPPIYICIGVYIAIKLIQYTGMQVIYTWKGVFICLLYICIVQDLKRKLNWCDQLEGGVHLPLVSIRIYTGISLYFLISWLFRMCSHWQHWKARVHLELWQFQWGTICLWYLYPYIYWYFLIFSYKLTVSNGVLIGNIEKHRVHLELWQFQLGGDHLPLVSVSLYILVFPYIF